MLSTESTLNSGRGGKEKLDGLCGATTFVDPTLATLCGERRVSTGVAAGEQAADVHAEWRREKEDADT